MAAPVPAPTARRDGVLTVNAGSSSLKLGLFEASRPPRLLLTCVVERIGDGPRLSARDGDGTPLPGRALAMAEGADHRAALAAALALVGAHRPPVRIVGVGHRIVHGGPVHDRPIRLDAAAIAALERLAPFAPLHQPHNLAGVRAAAEAFPDAPQIACFDTAFHHGHPFVSDAYALPRAWYDRGVRRYGFHGLSYQHVAGELARSLPALAAGRVVIAHLGAGASMCALEGGRSIASTMGFSALDGLPMATRCGQIDPGVLLYLMEQEGMGPAALSDLLYRRSGLLGLSGLSGDMRDLLAAGPGAAADAIDYFTARVRRELGGLAAALGGLDALVFTGGIGENAAAIRARICEGMGWLGLALDAEANAAGARDFSAATSRVRLLRIPTDEESVIARAVSALTCAGPPAAPG